MSWVTWRQHRLEALWALVLGAILGAFIALVAFELHQANCEGAGQSYCFQNDVWGQLAQQLERFNLYTYGLVVLPALAGAFIGCPLVAGEIENGTHRVAWTQGITRLRWLVTKLALVFIPVLVIAAVVGMLEVVLINQQGSQANRWAFFDQQAPMTVAATLLALALGVACGAVVGKSVPAMAVTLVAFVIIRIGIAELARPFFQAPLAFTTHDMSAFNSPPAGNPTAWWIDQASFYDSTGRLLSSGGYQPPASVAYAIQHYQPGDRFWAFQGIESAILVALALVLIGFATYWVIRRVS
ncbi:MAG TPA: ABC transporter permease subunit [Candidatus Dormibacteraeota bacterium]|nr:ABC transporter permease subunit [Candidatus Dormibacteraeota bacterium]